MDIQTAVYTENNASILVNGNLSVPIAEGNRHYQLVMAWVAEGNTIAPYVAPPRVKQPVNSASFWAVLSDNDIQNVTKAEVLAKAEQLLPVSTKLQRQKKAAIINVIDTGTTMDPQDQTLVALAASFGITNGDFDSLWFEAEDLTW